MIQKLHFKNFKAWADSGAIEMAPLTVFCGSNSSGKSSIMQLLLMLKQTVESYDRHRVLHFGDDDSWVDLGTYKDLIHKHDTSQNLTFDFEIDAAKIRVVDAVKRSKPKDFKNLRFGADISFNQSTERTVLESMTYTLINQEDISFSLSRDGGKYNLRSNANYKLKRHKGRGWALPHPENFFGFPDEALAYYQNTGFLQDLSLAINHFFKNFFYVGPLREPPEPLYHYSGEIPPHVGERGTLAVNSILAASGRKISRGYNKKYRRFDEQIAYWLKRMGLIHSFEILPISKGRKEYEVRIRIAKESPEVLITDVGFGISQVLPVIVQSFYAPKNGVMFFEQPEIHLHPSVQSNLGDMFIEAIRAREKGVAKKNNQIIVESHSEHLIRRLQRRIAEGVVSADEVAIYFIEQKSSGAVLQRLVFDQWGRVTNWPRNFFGDDTGDLLEMSRAVQRRRKEKSTINGS